MLTEVGDGVFVRQSAFCRSNAVAVRGPEGLLLVDPGVSAADLDELADDLAPLGPVRAGFATHGHWDHVLWHPRLGEVPRWATARCVAALDRPAARAAAARDGAPVDLLGLLTPLPGAGVPGFPDVRVVAHDGHSPGHAALVVRDVLVAGDVLSDVEVPLLDLDAADPLGDHRAGLARLPRTAVLVPGHGAVARGPAVEQRFAADGAYLAALAAGREPVDPRLDAGPAWLAAEHAAQVARVLSGPPRTAR
jgi:glyoxylase-like metal-dependent hydrolase (beta-lactamase superfamily II)